MAEFQGGNLKSAAKLLILKKYAKPYLDILQSRFPECWYVDTHAGTGKHRCANGSLLDGSALTILKEYGDRFDRFYLYELDSDHYNSLVSTLSNELGIQFSRESEDEGIADFPVAKCNEPYIRIMQTDSNAAVEWLCDNASAQNHWLTFIDPAGLDVYRSMLTQLTNRGTMDILLNFPTDAVLRNVPQGGPKMEKSFGKDVPVETDREGCLNAIVNILQENPEWDVDTRNTMTDRDGGHRFDLVFTSTNDTAMSIMDDIWNHDKLWEEANEMIGQRGLSGY